MKNRRIITLSLAALAAGHAHGQRFEALLAPCGEGHYNTVQPLHSDSLSSSFLICVPHEVKPHYHALHTEHVVVIDGEATLLLGGSLLRIGPGDVIAIPKGTVHAVTTTSPEPLRVASIQAPRFDGTDRVPVER